MLPAVLLDALEALSAVGARPTDVAWFHCRILTATVNRLPLVTPKPEKKFINLSSSVHRFDGSMWQNFRFKERSPHQELSRHRAQCSAACAESLCQCRLGCGEVTSASGAPMLALLAAPHLTSQ
ncbi:unnamed protein product [Symbiodinium sp. CCMP2592]|nr:unnamed protein product [Symbiodinium sp. CCMP2592]